jgi:predicted flap endonuclease-1-like 5' DNA nuclease
MMSFTEFLNQLPEFAGIFILMFSTFLIGYFSSWWLHSSKDRKTINRLKQEVNALKSPKHLHDIETIFTEIKPKIIEVMKENREEMNLAASAPEKIAEKARTSYVTYTKSAPELNFDSFGQASFEDREDLTQINGIGPYIEQKLNEIGIYTYEQISRLQVEDIRTITELIDFFPGRIERDNWVGQAKSLNVF